MTTLTNFGLIVHISTLQSFEPSTTSQYRYFKIAQVFHIQNTMLQNSEPLTMSHRYFKTTQLSIYILMTCHTANSPLSDLWIIKTVLFLLSPSNLGSYIGKLHLALVHYSRFQERIAIKLRRKPRWRFL